VEMSFDDVVQVMAYIGKEHDTCCYRVNPWIESTYLYLIQTIKVVIRLPKPGEELGHVVQVMAYIEMAYKI